MFIGNKKRYIEVLQCSGEDMNLVLTNGVQVPTSTGLLPTIPPPAAAPQFIPTQRPLISPGGTMLPSMPPAAAPAPYTGGLPGMISPYGQMAAAQMAAAYTQPGLIGASQAAAASAALVPPTMTGMTAIPQRPAAAVNPGSAYQPILYWYPSPPVSPQSSYYVHTSPTTVALKGLPVNVSLPDILGFLDGVYEVTDFF